jgi:hypothetical protein
MSDHPPRPEPPHEPGIEECCGSGCERCVFDLYQDALEIYRRQLAEWEAASADPPD